MYVLSPLPSHSLHGIIILCLIQERARDEKNAEITGRIKAALACGIKVLDDAFDQLEINSEGKLHVHVHVHILTIGWVHGYLACIRKG